MATQAPVSSEEKKARSTRIGVVTSAARDKTRSVEVEYQEVHPKYGKRLKRAQRFHVHDEDNASALGDRVEIASCRPLSKTKSHELIRIVEKAPAVVTHAQLAPIQEEEQAAQESQDD